IVVLKNNGGTEDNRVRKLDYSIQLSKLVYERFMKNEDLTLFSPHEVPDLYDAFGTPEFDELYERYEKDRKLKYKKKVSARSLKSLIVKERTETRRIYIMNIDHANSHQPWDTKVYMSNLCCEVLQPTIPLKSIEDPEGEVGTCTLGALNILNIKDE